MVWGHQLHFMAMGLFGIAACSASLECQMMKPLILASASPRRKALLTQLGVQFDVVVSNIDECRHSGEDPGEYVARLSREKALAVQHHPDKGGDPETMTKLNNARDLLLEPEMEAIPA